jgi:hypothetical protein
MILIIRSFLRRCVKSYRYLPRERFRKKELLKLTVRTPALEVSLDTSKRFDSFVGMAGNRKLAIPL